MQYASSYCDTGCAVLVCYMKMLYCFTGKHLHIQYSMCEGTVTLATVVICDACQGTVALATVLVCFTVTLESVFINRASCVKVLSHRPR